MKSTLKIVKNEPLKRYSTFDIGGPAQFLVQVSTMEELEEALSFAKEQQLPILSLGRGSNCLFHDEGFCGLALVNRISFFHKEGGGYFHVGAGYSFAQLGRMVSKEGFSGLEFAASIPASLGGAIYMNAGASGQETKDVLCDVTTMDFQGYISTYAACDLSFGYRVSSFQKKKEVICSARLRLSSSSLAFSDMKEKSEYRTKTQPYSERSIGCFFRNPPGISAGKLIDQAGLKGYAVGGAEVSSLHANFLINRGGATAEHVRLLALEVVEKVQQHSGILLESEVKILDPQGNSLPLLRS